MRSALIAASTASRSKAPRLAGALLRTQPDARLALLAGEGSEAAFEEIVRRYRPGLVAFAARISSRDSADDIVQDSVVKAHTALLRGDRPDAPRAWLFRIVRNTALNDRRDRKPHVQLDESHDGVEQPPEAIDRRRRLRDLVAAMRALPRAQREALVQRALEGKGHDEIAAALEISPGAVRQLIFRARATLRAGLGALVPVQLMRAAVLSGATEQAGTGAAATGAGVAAKLGIGAMITTGALFAGATAIKHDRQQARSGRAGAAVASKAAGDASASHATRSDVQARPTHRRTVIVRPKSSSPRQVAPTPSRSITRQPSPDRSPTPTQSNPPPPSTGPTGGGGSGATSGGSIGPDSQSTMETRSADCQDGGIRDPAPGGVSPR